MDWNSLLDLIIPAALGVFGGAIVLGWGWLRARAKASTAEWDDKVIKTFEDAILKNRVTQVERETRENEERHGE